MSKTRVSMIKLGVKGLAKYMTSGAAAQRKVLRDYKFPDPEGTAQAKYYRDARKHIVALHQNGHDDAWLLQKADQLDALAGRHGGRSAVRLTNNARGLRNYARAFTSNPYEILPDLSLYLDFGPVRVTVAPELHVRERGQEKIIKLDFATNAPDNQLIKIITQAMYEAAAQNGLGLQAASVLYMDVPRHKVHRGARMGARLTRDIEAACETISAVWDTLQPERLQ